MYVYVVMKFCYNTEIKKKNVYIIGLVPVWLVLPEGLLSKLVYCAGLVLDCMCQCTVT